MENNRSHPAPLFLSTGQFAKVTNLSATTVRRMCKVGLLAHIVISERGDRRIPASEVDRMLDRAVQHRTTEHND